MPDRLLALIATIGPVGKLPAPGTAGSLAALIAGVLILASFGHGGLVLALILATIVAFPAIAGHYRLTGSHDASEVVIDEVVGQWLAMLILPGYGAEGFWVGVIAVFALFRLFDILKPGPIGKAEAIPGASGVVADDAFAGVIAGAMTAILLWFWLSGGGTA